MQKILGCTFHNFNYVDGILICVPAALPPLPSTLAPPCPIFLKLFLFISIPAGADINSAPPEASLTVGTDNNVFRGAKESGGIMGRGEEHPSPSMQAFLRA